MEDTVLDDTIKYMGDYSPAERGSMVLRTNAL
jgi:hypothetical protein